MNKNRFQNISVIKLQLRTVLSLHMRAAASSQSAGLKESFSYIMFIDTAAQQHA